MNFKVSCHKKVTDDHSELWINIVFIKKSWRVLELTHELSVGFEKIVRSVLWFLAHMHSMGILLLGFGAGSSIYRDVTAIHVQTSG